MTRCSPGTLPRPWESRNSSGVSTTRLSAGLLVIAATPIASALISVRYRQAPSAARSVPGAPRPHAERAEGRLRGEERRRHRQTALPAAASSPGRELGRVEQAAARHGRQRRHDRPGRVLAVR